MTWTVIWSRASARLNFSMNRAQNRLRFRMKRGRSRKILKGRERSWEGMQILETDGANTPLGSQEGTHVSLKEGTRGSRKGKVL